MGWKCQKGQALIQALVTVGVVVTIVTIVSMNVDNIRRQNTKLGKRLRIDDLQSRLSLQLGSGSILDYELTHSGAWITQAVPVTFSDRATRSSSPPSVQLNQILTSAGAGSTVLAERGTRLNSDGSGFDVSGIQISKITRMPTNPNSYSAQVVISLNDAEGGSAVKPIEIPITLTTSGSGSVKTITGVQSSAGFTRGADHRRVVPLSLLARYHPYCGPASGYSDFRGPASGHPSSGFLLKHCFAACNRYCSDGCTPAPGSCPPVGMPGLGFASGVLAEYNEATNSATCICIP